MTDLFPSIEPYATALLDVGDSHKVFVEQSGNPNGKPVVYLHGGPGAGNSPATRQFFDPEIYRIVHFDQRGCGQSTPHASLEANTTWHLVSDMEIIRQHLGIAAWQICGGSWGSTLALAYAQTHPERVTELILRGLFLDRKKEMRWAMQEGPKAVYPDYWEAFEALIPEEERGDMLSAYYRRVTGDDEAVQLAASRAWCLWEFAIMTLVPNPDYVENLTDEFALAMGRTSCHYFHHASFMESDDQLLDGIDTIRHIPTVMIQGRHDLVTPMLTAWELHQRWPEASLQIIDGAGHSAAEPGIATAIMAAAMKFAVERE
ncbi:MAG: prolyl aminopeptidase [Parasphingorhabdus sp.]|uniref:prolyl aminopeptidase n=1 Tax=Parasphingorhabdus sp. TaxID=2709688 RepID=UPI003299BCF7